MQNYFGKKKSALDTKNKMSLVPVSISETGGNLRDRLEALRIFLKYKIKSQKARWINGLWTSFFAKSPVSVHTNGVSQLCASLLFFFGPVSFFELLIPSIKFLCHPVRRLFWKKLKYPNWSLPLKVLKSLQKQWKCCQNFIKNTLYIEFVFICVHKRV